MVYVEKKSRNLNKTRKSNVRGNEEIDILTAVIVHVLVIEIKIKIVNAKRSLDKINMERVVKSVNNPKSYRFPFAPEEMHRLVDCFKGVFTDTFYLHDV